MTKLLENHFKIYDKTRVHFHSCSAYSDILNSLFDNIVGRYIAHWQVFWRFDSDICVDAYDILPYVVLTLSREISGEPKYTRLAFLKDALFYGDIATISA